MWSSDVLLRFQGKRLLKLESVFAYQKYFSLLPDLYVTADRQKRSQGKEITVTLIISQTEKEKHCMISLTGGI